MINRRRQLPRSHRVRGMGKSSATLSMEQIANVAAAAGFAGDDLPAAVAVSWSESQGGDPRAFNPEGSYGLWQIYIPAHPEFAQAAGSGQLYDPAINAAAAFKVYSDAGQSFHPWSDYKNGKYLRYLPAAQQAVMSDARGDSSNQSGADLRDVTSASGGRDLPIATTDAAGDLPPGQDLPTSTSPVILVLAVGAAVVGVKIIADLFD